MKIIATLSLFYSTGLLAVATVDRFLLFPNTPPQLAQYFLPEHTLYTDGEIAIVQTSDDGVEEWADRIHKELLGCGGFFDVTLDVQAGKMPELIVWEELSRKESSGVTASFTLGEALDVGQLVAGVSKQKWWDFLNELSSMPDRSATTEGGTKAVQFLKDRADLLGKGLKGFRTWTVATATYPNQASVIASLPGSDPSAPHVVIGGHMDTFSNNKPGADDDGSGSAIVMEALRTVAEAKATFKHSIDFIWYAAEERGLVGSGNVVDHFKKTKIPVKAAIQFDMVGWNSPNDTADIFLMTDNTNAALNDALRKIITRYTNAKIGETVCGYPCSDHVNWSRGAIPAVFPFESSFANMNKRLHTPEDKINFLDKDHALFFAQTAVAFLGELAVLQ